MPWPAMQLIYRWILPVYEQRVNLLGINADFAKPRAENQSMYLQRPDLGRLLAHQRWTV